MASRQAVPSDTFRPEPLSNRLNPSRRRRFVSLAYRRRRQSSHAWARPCLAQRPCLGQRPLSWASEAQAILRQTLHTSAMLVRTSTSVESITNHVSQKGSGYVPCQCPGPGTVNTCTPSCSGVEKDPCGNPARSMSVNKQFRGLLQLELHPSFPLNYWCTLTEQYSCRGTEIVRHHLREGFADTIVFGNT